jgi:hypothetical protein
MTKQDGDPNPDSGISGVGEFEDAIRAIALARGKSPEEVLSDADRHLAEHIDRPRAACLQPDDLVDYQAGRKLSVALESHIPQCVHCTRLLRAAKPDPNRVEDFLEAARKVRGKYQEIQPAMRPAWLDWRSVASVAAALALIVLAAGTQPVRMATMASVVPEATITATSTTDANAVPVTVRVNALQPNTVTVTGHIGTTQVAASTAALAKYPPMMTLPPYGSSGGSSTETLHREATEKTVAFIAGVLASTDSDADRFSGSTIKAVAQKEGSSVEAWDSKTGMLMLVSGPENRKIRTEINYLKTVKEATRNEEILETLKSHPSQTKVDLKNGFQLQWKGVGMPASPVSKTAK